MQQRVLHIKWKYPARVTQIMCSVTVLLFHRWREWQAQIHKIHFNFKNLITHFLIIVTGERRAGSRWPADLCVYSSGIAWQLRFGLLIPLQRDSENRHNPESSISRLSERRWLDFDGSRLQLVLRRYSRLSRFVGRHTSSLHFTGLPVYQNFPLYFTTPTVTYYDHNVAML